MNKKIFYSKHLDFKKKFYIPCNYESTGIFIDLEKAFDIVDHTLLLDKLCYYGIKGIANRWLKSYSSNHTHYVSNNSFNSNHKLRYKIEDTITLL